MRVRTTRPGPDPEAGPGLEPAVGAARGAIRVRALAACALLALGSPAAAEPGSGAAAEGAAAGSWAEYAVPDAQAARDARTRFPYTAEQMERVFALRRAEERARAFARPVPRRAVRIVDLALDDSRPVPAIRAAQGYATAVVFLDITGAPWPVRRAWMRPEFRAGEGEAEGGAAHVVYVAPSRAYDHGNVAVELEGLDLPVSLSVFVDGAPGAEVDYRIAIRVPRPGPNADPRALARPTRLRAGDPVLALFASGRAPEGAVRLLVEVADGVRGQASGLGPGRAGVGAGAARAWRFAGRLYLKTPHVLLAPGPTAFERGPDGEWIYELPDTPLVLASVGGARVRLGLRAARPLRPVLPELVEGPAGAPGGGEVGAAGTERAGVAAPRAPGRAPGSEPGPAAGRDVR